MLSKQNTSRGKRSVGCGPGHPKMSTIAVQVGKEELEPTTNSQLKNFYASALSLNAALSKKKKLRRGSKMCAKSSTIVSRVHRFMLKLSAAVGPSLADLRNPVDLTSRACGISVETVRKSIKKPVSKRDQNNSESSDEEVAVLPKCSDHTIVSQTPSSKGQRLFNKIPADILASIRLEIHAQYKAGQRITLTALSNKTKEKLGDDFQWGVSSLWRMLTPLGFSFRKVTDRCIIYETPYLVRLRHAFLKRITELRDRDAFLCYVDETWLFEGMRCTHDWVDLVALANPQEFLDRGLKIGPNPTPSRGKRVIVIGLLTEKGMLPGATKIWQNAGNVEDGDYHHTMNSDLFLEWMDCILPKMKAAGEDRKAVLVLDNAAYHCESIEEIPTKSASREKIAAYLRKYGVACDATAPKATVVDQLTAFIDSRGGRRALRICKAEVLASLHGVELLFLPPHHCTLNPIEHVWAYLKDKICKTATGKEKLDEVRSKALEILDGMTPELARRFFDDARKNELDFIAKEDLSFSPTAIVADCNVMDEAAGVIEEETITSDVEEEEALTRDEWSMDWSPFTF